MTLDENIGTAGEGEDSAAVRLCDEISGLIASEVEGLLASIRETTEEVRGLKDAMRETREEVAQATECARQIANTANNMGPVPTKETHEGDLPFVSTVAPKDWRQRASRLHMDALRLSSRDTRLAREHSHVKDGGVIGNQTRLRPSLCSPESYC